MEIFLEPNSPNPQILVVGESPLGRALASLGRLLGYRVAVAAIGASPEGWPDADIVIPEVEDLSEHLTVGTYAIVASMGRYDETVLRQLLDASVPYVGLVASRRRAESVMDNLRREGVPQDALERIRNPAGLDLAAKTQEEIALSIMAEVTEIRRRTESPSMEGLTGGLEAAAVQTPTVDVVCGMTVDPATSLHAEHAGTMYYFCSEGCQSRFVEDPASFLA